MKMPMQKIRGVILVMAALILVVLMGVAALALDLGRLFILHTEMQNSVDAAVLSAVVELDGEAGARGRAKLAANQEMLNHRAHFSKQGALLKDLEDELISTSDVPGVFTFYSWIGSNVDGSVPPCGTNTIDDGKCGATGDDDASYVQIELDPDLLSTNDDRYEIDLYFLPVLSVFGVDTATEASTRVVALAGSHTEVCNYPPMFICDPTEAVGVDPLVPGQLVTLHEQGPGAPWASGTFGWLIPTKSTTDDDLLDDSLVSNKLLAHRLGSKYGQQCSSTIEVKGGQIAGWPRWGLNTRFGLYERSEHENDTFPSAPNVVDYPRDDFTHTGLPFTETGDPCEDFTYVKFGNTDWLTTESGCEDQPSTFGEADYIANYHGVTDPGKKSRLEYYNWELSAGNLPENTMTIAELHDDEEQCIDSSNTPCRMLFGDPSLLNSVPNTIDDGSNKRRELFVSAVACVANDVKANSIINVEEVGGKWMRFFMTEHVSTPPSGQGVTIYAEFIEEVTDKDDEHFKKVIQLYE